MYFETWSCRSSRRLHQDDPAEYEDSKILTLREFELIVIRTLRFTSLSWLHEPLGIPLRVRILNCSVML